MDEKQIFLSCTRMREQGVMRSGLVSIYMYVLCDPFYNNVPEVAIEIWLKVGNNKKKNNNIYFQGRYPSGGCLPKKKS